MTTRSPRMQLWVILAITFFGFLGLSMPYLIFPTLFLNPDHSILSPGAGMASHGLFLGITLAAYPLGQFFGSPILGALSDDYGRRNVMSTSLVIAAAFSLLTALSLEWKSLWLLISSRFCAGLMEGNLAIARAMAADIKELNKHDTFGKINAAASIAYVIGPLVGGLLSDSSLYEGFALSTPFFLICALFATLSLTSFLALQKRPKSALHHGRSIWERINLVGRLKRLFKNRVLKRLLFVSSLFTVAVDIFYEFGPVYLTAKWLSSPAELALYNGALSAALALGNGWLAGFVAKRYPNHAILIWSMSGFSTILLGIVLTTSAPLMLTLFAAAGLAIAVAVTNVTVQISDAASDAIQGEVLGVQLSLRVLGDAVICLLGGALLALSPILVLLLAVVASSSSLVYYLFTKRSTTA